MLILKHAQVVVMEPTMLQDLIQEIIVLDVIQFVLLVKVHQQFVQNVIEIINYQGKHA
jgi:hypothetical protein